MNKPAGKILVGLTGGFGTGKSTVAHIFESHGASIVNADTLAHEALFKDSPVYAEIKKIFDVPEDKLGLDRKRIAEIIFRDPVRRKQLEAIVHPFVWARMVEEATDAESRVVVLEVPLLFESGFDKFCDFVVTVSASQQEAVKRLLEKGFSVSEIEARTNAQLPLEEKIRRSKYKIENSGTLDATRREVEKVWKDLPLALKGEK